MQRAHRAALGGPQAGGGSAGGRRRTPQRGSPQSRGACGTARAQAAVSASAVCPTQTTVPHSAWQPKKRCDACNEPGAGRAASCARVQARQPALCAGWWRPPQQAAAHGLLRLLIYIGIGYLALSLMTDTGRLGPPPGCPAASRRGPGAPGARTGSAPGRTPPPAPPRALRPPARQAARSARAPDDTPRLCRCTGRTPLFVGMRGVCQRACA